MKLRGMAVCCGVWAVAAAFPAWSQEAREIPEAAVSPAAQHAFEEGRDYEKRKQLSAAVDSYHEALKASGGVCTPCLDAIFRTQIKMEEFKDAAGTAAQLAKDAPDASTKAQAEYREGSAWYQLSFAQSEGRGAISKDPKHAPASLKEADAALQRALVDDPGSEPIRMLHAHVLASLKRDEDASHEFTACASAHGVSQQECARALRFAHDVSAARDEAAPAFELQTVDGQKISLDSLTGKVVLVDFWATWCPYCIRDSDYVQTMVDTFPPDKFVLLEVDADESEGKWKNYVAEHRLEGTQTRDGKGEVADAFHVSGYPTYIVLDSDGMIRLRAVGIEGDLKGTVRKLIEEQKAGQNNARIMPSGPSGQ